MPETMTTITPGRLYRYGQYGQIERDHTGWWWYVRGDLVETVGKRVWPFHTLEEARQRIPELAGE